MPTTRRVIATEAAPKAVGPYSQAITEIPLDPATGTLVDGTIEDQTRQVLANLRAVLEAAGSGLDRVVKVTVFMTDLGDFQRMNAVYATAFSNDPPARSAVGVGALPLGAQVEMECVALGS